MKKILERVFSDIFEDLGYDPSFAKVSVSNRPELCDFQINGVFAIAKKQGKSPKEIGEQVVDKVKSLEDFSSYFKEVSFVMPGFINIKVSDELISKCLNNIITSNTFGIEKIKEDKTCIVDYGGPNIAKPLHVGHMRPAIIGQSIYEILKAKGYKVIGDAHLGDIGLQMGEVIYGLLENNIKPEEVTMEVLQDIYPKMSALCKENEEVLEKCRKLTSELQRGLNPMYEDYYKAIYSTSLTDIKRIYKYFDVDFDYWYGEKDSYKYVDDLISFLEEQGVTEIDDDALIVRVDKEDDKKEIPPLIIRAKSGAYLYATSDIATIYQRMKDFNPDYILYVVDDRQSLHFEQIFRACQKSGLTKGVVLEHNGFGTINDKSGKPFKTRSGETLKLEELIKMTKDIFVSKKESNKDMNEEDINKIVNSILKFADLQNNREKNYIFDIDKFADVNGKTGPYILYTAVRIRKIFSQFNFDKNISDTIYNDDDRNLRMKLLEVGEVVDKACENRMPHYIADYLYDLCVLVNTFYQNNNISNLDDEQNKKDWVNLLDYTYSVIEKLLSLLKIEIPSKM